jgi:hypothetical protein
VDLDDNLPHNQIDPPRTHAQGIEAPHPQVLSLAWLSVRATSDCTAIVGSKGHARRFLMSKST